MDEDKQVVPETPTPVKADVGVTQEAPKVTPSSTTEVATPVDQAQEHINKLKATYDRQLATLRKEREQSAAEVENLRLQALQAAPPEQRMSYLQDYYGRRTGELERDRDIARAALQHNIPIEELEEAKSPEQLQAIVNLKLKEREIDVRLNEERKKMQAQLEKDKDTMMAEAVQRATDAILAKMGQDQVVGSTGQAAVGGTEAEIAEINTKIKALAGSGDTTEVLKLTMQRQYLENSRKK